MLTYLKKFTSRKFLLSLLTIIGGVSLLLTELGQPEAVEIAAKISGALIALGGVLGYNLAEAKVDAAREASK